MTGQMEYAVRPQGADELLDRAGIGQVDTPMALRAGRAVGPPADRMPGDSQSAQPCAQRTADEPGAPGYKRRRPLQGAILMLRHAHPLPSKAHSPRAGALPRATSRTVRASAPLCRADYVFRQKDSVAKESRAAPHLRTSRADRGGA